MTPTLIVLRSETPIPDMTLLPRMRCDDTRYLARPISSEYMLSSASPATTRPRSIECGTAPAQSRGGTLEISPDTAREDHERAGHARPDRHHALLARELRMPFVPA